MYEGSWNFPLIRYSGILYPQISFPRWTFYTSAQINKTGTYFGHRLSDELFNLLKISGKDAIDSLTRIELEKILAACEPCHRIKNASFRFRVWIGHAKIRFNARVYIDTTYLNVRPVLHIVDEQILFYAACFLPKTSADAIWDAIVLCWSSVYTGLPKNMMVDEGWQFRKVFVELDSISFSQRRKEWR